MRERERKSEKDAYETKKPLHKNKPHTHREEFSRCHTEYTVRGEEEHERWSKMMAFFKKRHETFP